MIPEGLEHFFKDAVLTEEIVEGDVSRYIYTGDNIQIVIYHFPPNKVFPVHSHTIHEQVGFLFTGKMGFNVGGEKRDLLPGDFYRAPIGIEHNAWTYEEPSILIDIFSPVREDLIKK